MSGSAYVEYIVAFFHSPAFELLCAGNFRSAGATGHYGHYQQGYRYQSVELISVAFINAIPAFKTWYQGHICLLYGPSLPEDWMAYLCYLDSIPFGPVQAFSTGFVARPQNICVTATPTGGAVTQNRACSSVG